MAHGQIMSYIYLLTELGIITVDKCDFIVIKSLTATLRPSTVL